MDQIVDSIDAFRQLAPESKRALGQILRREHLKRGETLFCEGEPVRGFYAVTAGGVKVYKIGEDGSEAILHLIGPGECFAECCVLFMERYPASATTIRDSDLLFVPGWQFRQLIAERPDIALAASRGVSQKNCEFAEKIGDLALRDVEGRLARYLLGCANGTQTRAAPVIFELPVSKRDLAAHLGTVPETLSRALSKLKYKGLVSEEGRRLSILDLEGLGSLARR